MRLRRVAHARELVHQLLVDLQAAGGVDDHRVEALGAGPLDAAARRLDRDPSCRFGRPGTSICAPSCSSWSIAAGRCRSAATRTGLRPCLRSCERELRGGRRLARALEAGEQDHRRACRRRARRRPRPSASVSSSWTTLTTCWPGVRLFSTSSPSACSRTRATKSRTTVEVDVGLEQREADLAHRARDRLLVELAPLAKVAESALELV